MSEYTEQELRRREALQALKEADVNPYPTQWDVDSHASEIIEKFDDAIHQAQGDEPAKETMVVSIAGRMMNKRVMGKASFIEIQDASGTIQVYVKRNDLPEGFYNTVFKKLLDIGDLIGIKGYVFRTKTGHVSVHTTELQLLSKALRPIPVVKEKEGVRTTKLPTKNFVIGSAMWTCL